MQISPAPWFFEVKPTKTKTILRVIDQDHNVLAVVNDKPRLKVANGNLIAAAPEMLQALDYVLRASDRGEAFGKNGKLHPFLIHIIEEAVNKAQGKPAPCSGA
jgi:hypothetical protein